MLATDDVIKILIYAKRGYRPSEMTKKFGASRNSVSRIVAGKAHKKLFQLYFVGDTETDLALPPLSELPDHRPPSTEDDIAKRSQRVARKFLSG